MASDVRALLGELRRALSAVYGPRLKGLYLFGSHARGTAEPDSDVDVLVVLDEVPRYGAEVERTSEVVGRLSLFYGVALSRVFVTERDWQRGSSAFLDNVRREALAA
jgi:predicted nucleotidyltransferase